MHHIITNTLYPIDTKFDKCIKNIKNMQLDSYILKIGNHDSFFLMKIVVLRYNKVCSQILSFNYYFKKNFYI